MPLQYHETTVHSVVSDPDDPHTFLDSSYKVDDQGCLHIFRALNAGHSQQVASFGAHSWHLVTTDVDMVDR